MLKLILLLIGFLGGGAAASGYLLSEPGSDVLAASDSPSNGLGQRVEVVKTHLRQAREEGARAGQATETRLRAQLDSDRRGTALGRPS